MLRISLIIVIVAGLAAAGLNFYQVRQVMVTTMNERDAEKSAKEQEQQAHSQTKRTLSQTEETLASTKKKLDTTEANLKQTSERLVAMESRAAELDTRLNAAVAERNAAQQELAAYQNTGIPPEAIRGMVADLKNTKEQIAIMNDEMKVLDRKKNQLEQELAYLRGERNVVELPKGLKGRIVAVDPKYDFVVLDIGEEKGALERGEMLINRNGKLVGRIQIAAVQANQSIANVLQDWKNDEVMEGDQVIAVIY
ncbi:MAG: hypothetical protein ACK4UN_03470 [Limisphaerales bacterium]